MKTSTGLWVGILTFMSLFFTDRVAAGGISTPFGKVIVENLSIGKTYRTSELSRILLTVKNNSEATTGLEMKILKPSPERKLPEGCEPIPDTSWIKLEQYDFVIDPGEEAKTDVVITIPDDEAYMGKKYVVFILSRTTRGMIRLALESTLILGISGSKNQSAIYSNSLASHRMSNLAKPARIKE